MNTRAILAIVRKDLKVAMQNKGVVLPIVVAPESVTGTPLITELARPGAVITRL